MLYIMITPKKGINMKLHRYPSIETFRNLITGITLREQYRGKDAEGNPIYDTTIPAPTVELHGTVKLHGTNGSIVLNTNGEYYAQSREAILSLKSDNENFCLFSERSKSHIQPILNKILNQYSMAKSVIIFGEWCGKGIKKGVGISELEKMFVLFGIKIKDANDETIWISNDHLKELVSEEHRIFNIYDFTTYKVTVDFSNLDEAVKTLTDLTETVEKECPVAKHFGCSNLLGEGIVWIGEHNGDMFRMKTKGEKHSVVKTKKIVEIDVEKVNSIDEFVEYAVTENRLDQGFDIIKSLGHELTPKSTGHFVKWVFDDVVKEESDTLIKNNLSPKDVSFKLNIKAKNYFLDKVRN